MDQGSSRKCSAVHNFAPTVTKFCVMWEGQALPHDTKLGNCRCEIVGRRMLFIWSLIHGSSWSGLIKVGPDWFGPLQSPSKQYRVGNVCIIFTEYLASGKCKHDVMKYDMKFVMCLYQYTVETLYNTINFCWNTYKRHSIARPKGRGMGCLLWVQRATYCVDLSILSSINICYNKSCYKGSPLYLSVNISTCLE